MKQGVVAISMVVSMYSMQAAPFHGDVQGAFVWGVVNVGGLNSAIVNGKVQSLPSVPGKGGELEVNYPLPHSDCSIGIEGLLFSAHYTAQISSPSSALHPTWGDGSSWLESVKTHYRLHLGCADVKWATQIVLTPSLSVRPFVALMFASLRQKYFLDEQPYFEQPEVLWRTKNKYWGLGPEWGAKVKWEWSKWLALQVGANLSLLYGPFYVHEGRRLQPGEKQMRLFHEWSLGTTVMRMGVGFCWYPGTVSRPFVVEVGGDQWMFFSQNQLTRAINQSPGLIFANQGDISLTGGYVRLGYRF